MKKLILSLTIALALSGCEQMKAMFPKTVAGFESGGVLGALDGGTGAVLATCETLDGQIVRVAVDDLAIETGTTDLVSQVRDAREKACRMAGSVRVLVD